MKPKKTNKRHLARALALQALYRWHFTQDAPKDWLPEFMSEHLNAANDIDFAFFQTLVNGVIVNQVMIDKKMTPFLDRPIDTLNPVELAVLRLGCYELVYCPDVPPNVVINEAVELTKAFGATDGYKYVNGVLDAIKQSSSTSVDATK